MTFLPEYGVDKSISSLSKEGVKYSSFLLQLNQSSLRLKFVYFLLILS